MPRTGLIAVVVCFVGVWLGGRWEERNRGWSEGTVVTCLVSPFAPGFDRSEPNCMRETSRALIVP